MVTWVPAFAAMTVSSSRLLSQPWCSRCLVHRATAGHKKNPRAAGFCGGAGSASAAAAQAARAQAGGSQPQRQQAPLAQGGHGRGGGHGRRGDGCRRVGGCTGIRNTKGRRPVSRCHLNAARCITNRPISGPPVLSKKTPFLLFAYHATGATSVRPVVYWLPSTPPGQSSEI